MHIDHLSRHSRCCAAKARKKEESDQQKSKKIALNKEPGAQRQQPRPNFPRTVKEILKSKWYRSCP